MIVIPAGFAADIQRREGNAGRAWIASLPQIVAELCQRWNLSVDGTPLHGHLALVVPVQRGTECCVLKVSWRDSNTILEAHALRRWNGRGTVRLLDANADHNAMLLERLDASRTLFDLPIDQAMPIAGRIVRSLAVPGDAVFPTAAGLASEIAHTGRSRWEGLGRPIPMRQLEQAIELAESLSSSTAHTMVNWDLHYGNVLFSSSRQQWVAIDPKAATGAPESGIASLLWTRFSDIPNAAAMHRLLDALIEAAELDALETRAWTLVRVVDFWLWAVSIGLTEVPKGCATIVDWLELH